MIHPTSVISKNAEIHESTNIGPFCVIGKGVNIGKNKKTSVKQSFLDYHLTESPYSISIHLKKIFMSDFSSKCSPQSTSTPNRIFSQSGDFDSGCQRTNECSTCDENNTQIEDVKKITC